MKSKLAVAFGAVSTLMVAMASAASAQTAPTVESAFEDASTQITTVAGLGLGVIIVALGVGIGARLVIKWIRKAVSAA